MARTRRRKKNTSTRESDPRRWAYLIFVLGGFMGAWVLSHAIEDVWAMIWSWQPQIRRPDALWSNIAGISIAVASTIYALRKQRWFKFSIEVVEEISQVTWPTRAETRAATIVVIIITLICSTILWGMDQIWSTVTNWLYGI
jgi:preprotein translocase subunit SecE